MAVVLYGFETWHLTLTEETDGKVFENRVVKKMSGPQRERGIGAGGNFTIRSFRFVVLNKYYPDDQLKKNEMGG